MENKKRDVVFTRFEPFTDDFRADDSKSICNKNMSAQSLHCEGFFRISMTYNWGIFNQLLTVLFNVDIDKLTLDVL